MRCVRSLALIALVLVAALSAASATAPPDPAIATVVLPSTLGEVLSRGSPISGIQVVRSTVRNAEVLARLTVADRPTRSGSAWSVDLRQAAESTERTAGRSMLSPFNCMSASAPDLTPADRTEWRVAPCWMPLRL